MPINDYEPISQLPYNSFPISKLRSLEIRFKMSSVEVETKSQAVTLKGSALLVKEFFGFGINSILYQRGIYPAGKKFKV